MKKVIKKIEKKDLPPYLSRKKLEKLFDIISTRSLGKIDPKYLQLMGIKGTDANVAVSTLRFLGIVDTDGNTTELAKKLQFKGKDKEETIQKIVRSVYSKLFERFTKPEPYELSKEELHNEFLSIYDISSRIAKSAVPAFLWLCSQGGLSKTQLKEIKKEAAPAIIKKRSDVFAEAGQIPLEPDNGHLTIPFGGGIRLMLPSDLSAQIMITEEFRKIIKVLIEFSKFSESLHKQSQKK